MTLLPTIPKNVVPLTISAVTAQIKSALEASFGNVWLVGEVGSLACPSSGHLYFNLKDKMSILRACMWRTTALRHRYSIKDGQEVIVRGKMTVYAPRGDYQLVVEELYQKGAGAQDQALRRLKEKLQRLGYFSPARKRALPEFPRRIALIASPTGAAVRDMLEIITRRWPSAEIWVCGVRVQGDGAPESIAAALDRLNEHPDIDVILLGRGGGSSEDLAAFNEEIVAHAIYSSAIPVVSAVGHEVDVTLADLVADRRAATPSEAAEIATPDRVELLETLQTRRQRLHALLMSKYQNSRQRLLGLAQRRVFRFPLERLREQERRLDDWEERLHRAIQLRIQQNRQQLEALSGQLESLSPLGVLSRGYSLTRTIPAQQVVRRIDQVQVGESVEIILPDGRLQAQVQSKQPQAPSAVDSKRNGSDVVL
jgi:exodeoxyribonuclease VII large subunit